MRTFIKDKTGKTIYLLSTAPLKENVFETMLFQIDEDGEIIWESGRQFALSSSNDIAFSHECEVDRLEEKLGVDIHGQTISIF